MHCHEKIKFMEISVKMYPAAIQKCFLTIKVNVGNNQEMAQSERNFNSKNRCGKTKLITRHIYKENIT